MASNLRTFKLNNDVEIPSIGVGTWMGGYVGVDDEAYRTTLLALQAGYRYIDTASGYNTEAAIGRAIKDSGVPREEIIIQTKLSPVFHGPGKVEESFNKSLEQLQTGWIDLFLIHTPFGWNPDFTLAEHRFTDVWAQMESLLAAGKCKSIGICNFSIPHLETLLASAKVVPVLNQVELHPYMPSLELKAFCESKNIHLQAYTPLGKGGDSPLLKDDELIKSLSTKHDVAPAQIVLAWASQRGTSALPKSSNADRLKQNINLPVLSDEEVNSITKIHTEDSKKHRTLFHANNGGKFMGLLPIDVACDLMKWDVTLYQ
ncbi:NADP-dependent oxidoreductase domain-containing protein [Flagelloscypha sp. PMI_526]|nr:NADP-dependent oxidoreductase domain-containing protein [Flagelloscypha sp. PMI_526]